MSSRSFRQSTSVLTRSAYDRVELSAAFLLVILAADFVAPEDAHLSTHLTPDPSLHLRSLPARFLRLSFRKPDEELYYKGREWARHRRHSLITS